MTDRSKYGARRYRKAGPLGVCTACGTATDRAGVNSERAAIYCATDGLNFTARLGMKFKISRRRTAPCTAT